MTIYPHSFCCSMFFCVIFIFFHLAGKRRLRIKFSLQCSVKSCRSQFQKQKRMVHYSGIPSVFQGVVSDKKTDLGSKTSDILRLPPYVCIIYWRITMTFLHIFQHKVTLVHHLCTCFCFQSSLS